MSEEHEARLIGKKDVEHGAHEVLGGDLVYPFQQYGNVGWLSALRERGCQ